MHGADVVVNDLAESEEGERRILEIEALGRRGAFIAADVTDPAAMEQLMAGTVERMGRLDIVVANAGLCDWQTVSELSAELWDRLVGVNLHGAFNTCRAAAAQMRAGGEGGRIIVTSSVHAQMPFVEMGVYGGTKQAIGHLVGVMAREWARDRITVNHIGPGVGCERDQRFFARLRDRGGAGKDPAADSRRPPRGRARGDGRGGRLPRERGCRLHDGRLFRVDGGLVMGPY